MGARIHIPIRMSLLPARKLVTTYHQEVIVIVAVSNTVYVSYLYSGQEKPMEGPKEPPTSSNQHIA